MKNLLLLLMFYAGGFVYAAPIANCSYSESGGLMNCKASESGGSVFANVSCKHGVDSTDCNGTYHDLSDVGLGFKCVNESQGVICSGGTADGYSFKMKCTNKNQNKSDCQINDSFGSSMSLKCDIGKDGLPNCFGNDGTDEFKIGCTTDNNGNQSCGVN